MNTKKGAKSERIKSCILKGRATISHYSNKIIAARIQIINFDCNCDIKCAALFSEEQKQEFFNHYNSLKSHEQQYLFLKSMVIPVNNNSNDKKNQKFEYFIETKCEKNEVKIFFSHSKTFIKYEMLKIIIF